MHHLGDWIVGSMIGCLLYAPVLAQVTQRVSVGSAGAQGNGQSQYPSISGDGRFVAFYSSASNLVPGDTNGVWDVFVRDRQLGTTECVSVSIAGAPGNAESANCPISADGRYVAFSSLASDLVPGDTNGAWDDFVRDRLTGTTERVSVDSAGAQGNDESTNSSISADGRYVAFSSRASNLVSGDTNLRKDIFVRDRQLGTTERINLGVGGVQANRDSYEPAISADGRFVAFHSDAFNLVGGDTNSRLDVFVYDRQLGTTERVSVDSAGVQGNDMSVFPSVSADGRFVAFHSVASNLVGGDTNGSADVFVRDRQLGTTERVSLDSQGVQGNNHSVDPLISADGRYVAFASGASNLVGGDTNGFDDIFVRDRQLGTTERVSLDSAGAQGNDHSVEPAISADGRVIAYWGWASNLVPGDTNAMGDVFIRDRFGGPSFTSLCDPGVAGVIACPCANPPSGSGRGCDNSSGTGGASISAAGGSYLSSDSLVFSADGEKPTATSIVLQGNASAASGVVYGQGVRCVAGLLKRLFVKTAVGGSITAPEFGVGDPTVSARSAAKGDVIQPGQSRYYLVYYRDPNVLGGCPASSTFNATQTGRIDWSP
jgi:Tol biopolymer transport system component